MVKHCSIWNFAQDFTEYMCRYYLTTTHSKLQLREGISTYCCCTMSRDVARYLVYLCGCFRKVFREVYALLGPIEILDEERFMKFCIPRCEAFYIPQDYMGLMIACAFISELNFVFIEANRPVLPYASWKTFLALFRRRYLIRFDLDTCWSDLDDFCRDQLQKVTASTHPPYEEMNVDHFTKHPFDGDEQCCRIYVLDPVKLCKKMPVFPQLNEYERVLQGMSVSKLKTRRLTRDSKCEICQVMCIEDMYHEELIDDQKRGCIDRNTLQDQGDQGPKQNETESLITLSETNTSSKI